MCLPPPHSGLITCANPHNKCLLQVGTFLEEKHQPPLFWPPPRGGQTMQSVYYNYRIYFLIQFVYQNYRQYYLCRRFIYLCCNMIIRTTDKFSFFFCSSSNYIVVLLNYIVVLINVSVVLANATVVLISSHRPFVVLVNLQF